MMIFQIKGGQNRLQKRHVLTGLKSKPLKTCSLRWTKDQISASFMPYVKTSSYFVLTGLWNIIHHKRKISNTEKMMQRKRNLAFRLMFNVYLKLCHFAKNNLPVFDRQDSFLKKPHNWFWFRLQFLSLYCILIKRHHNKWKGTDYH